MTTTPTASFPTGAQYEITGGGYTAVITKIGATLRALSHDGHELIKGFGAEETIGEHCRGQQLLPWPNRIRDGRWTWRGEEQQLPVNEVKRGTALHGLVRWLAWELVEHRADQVTQRVLLRPQHGWPATMEAILTHRVDHDGLTVDVLVANPGGGDLPFGYGAHPYLTVGEDHVDQITITADAGVYLAVEPDRLLPVELRPVDAEHDLRTPRPVAELDLDHAYTDLGTTNGRWEVTCSLGERHTTMWAEDRFPWLQVFTGDTHTDWGVAVEPMTCGPDAFNEGPTHDGLIVLPPGGRFAASWGIRGV